MTKSPLPRRVALLSSGPPISLKVLYCLQRLGIATDLIDIGAPSPARHSRYRRGYVRIPMPSAEQTGSQDAFAEVLDTYIRQRGIEGVVGGDISSTGVLHSVRDRLRGIRVFPTSAMNVLDLLDDKWRFQQFMVGHGIPCPRAVLLESLDQWEAAAESIGYPLIVKPLFGESGHGIVLMRDPGALYSHLRSGTRYAGLPLILQAFAPGTDADVSVLALDGRVVCHVVQAREAGCTLRFVDHPPALEVAERIVAAVGYTGVANIDIRIDERSDGVSVLECNPRFWYTLQASLWRGLNFVEAGFRLAAEEAPDCRAPTDGAYHLHGCLLRRVLWNPVAWRSIGLYNLKGLYQALSDPLPFLRS
ncbi:hypothetical protein B1C78_07765 [Thioalkalivibrio denitrificans]|uniref:ATP-grasp domain-containing protein n=1 Tax=Thioalkalivibrio denitrificans TaxID=108003 RepID=A0A1V3NIG7_9GAMM|nr:ATP-grasp domain-containing protein [Thioalkalivibrio denitrificans]OOG24899.1 hypothetical protein B1C78_07765 [Thioalkalivibrio denitrificans]